MTFRSYVIGLAVGYFLLWAYFSDWSLDRMIFWEGHEPSYPIWPWAPIARVGVGAVVFLAALFAIMSAEHKS